MSGRFAVLPVVAPNEEIISFLEDFLALAKSGELRSLAIAGVLQGKYVRSGFATGDASVFETLGAIEGLRYRFIVRNIEV